MNIKGQKGRSNEYKGKGHDRSGEHEGEKWRMKERTRKSGGSGFDGCGGGGKSSWDDEVSEDKRNERAGLFCEGTNSHQAQYYITKRGMRVKLSL